MRFGTRQSLLWVAVSALSTACAHEEKPQVIATPPPMPKAEAAVCPPQEAPPPPVAVDCEKDVKSVLGQTVLHFDFDQDQLTPMNRQYLDRLAQTLKACPEAKIVVEGNCDERGTEEYNIALGQRRAAVARRYLVDLGADPARVDTVSYGFERPADTRHDEEAWAMNRRDEFAIQGEQPARTAVAPATVHHRTHRAHGRTAANK